MLRVIAGILALGLTFARSPAFSAPAIAPPAPQPPVLAAAPDRLQPMNHWAYDAMTQIAMAGFPTGFPDNQFSGKWAQTRGQFAAALQWVLRDTGWVAEQGAGYRQLGCFDAMERLIREFTPELLQSGTFPAELEREIAALRELRDDPSPRGVLTPVPLGKPGRTGTLGNTAARLEGLRLAEDEWKRGELTLYSPEPLPAHFPAVSDPLPVRHDPGSPGQSEAAEVIAAHNRVVWRWLCEGRRPAGVRLDWLRQVVDLKEGWRRRGRTQRVTHHLDSEVFSTDGKFRFTFPAPFGLAPCIPSPLKRLGPRGQRDPFQRPLMLGFERNVQLALGPKGSGILFIRSEHLLDADRRQTRLRAVDLRTGWVLNVAAD